MGLLKGLDPLLTADLLHVLRSMGHGDKLCVCDCNFPAAATVADSTRKAPVIMLAGADLPAALNAICSVLPLDFFIERPAQHMAPQAGVSLPPAGQEVTAALKAAVKTHCEAECSPLERFAFYDEAKTCFAVVQTMERRPYGACHSASMFVRGLILPISAGNVILQKGVVGPDGNDLKP